MRTHTHTHTHTDHTDTHTYTHKPFPEVINEWPLVIKISCGKNLTMDDGNYSCKITTFNGWLQKLPYL